MATDAICDGLSADLTALQEQINDQYFTIRSLRKEMEALAVALEKDGDDSKVGSLYSGSNPNNALYQDGQARGLRKAAEAIRHILEK